MRSVLLTTQRFALFVLAALVCFLLLGAIQQEPHFRDFKSVNKKSTPSPPLTTYQDFKLCNKPKSYDNETLYIITPTYPRAEQLPELTRLSQTLRQIDNLMLILVEDAPQPTQVIVDYLNESGLQFVYLRAQMPEKYQKLVLKSKPRGVANRNAGLEWIRKNAKTGVFFFADDDNSYDIRIFQDIRSTKKVSMFPVGLVAKLGVSTPVVKDGKVIGFYDGWIAKRKFPVDMAGFAVNVNLLFKNPDAWMPYVTGYEEDGFLKKLNISYNDIEPKAHNCTKIWVWHTQTKKTVLSSETPKDFTIKGTNLDQVYSKIWIDKSKKRPSSNLHSQILDISKVDQSSQPTKSNKKH